MPLHIHCLQHIPFETPGYIAEWAEAMKHTLTYTRFYEADYNFPALEELDWLLIMGGAMACYEEDMFPFLVEEKRFIRNCIEAGKTVIGICLGSQLLAESLGARVYPNKDKEIGFLPVALQPAASSHPLLQGLPPVLEFFQWHGDTFDLPEGATLLATSEACKNQAFLKGKCVGMQFHWEADENIIRSMLEADRHELVEAPYIHQEERIVAELPKLSMLKPYLFRFLDRLALL
ncbi:type 1 glutamine amidotransferase [Pontibacter brevis]